MRMTVSGYTGQRRNVLVVEDDEDVRTLVEMILAKAGYEVESAANGVEALQLVRVQRYSLIVLDLAMPEMDGFTFLAQGRGVLQNTPVVVLSARNQSQDVKRAIELGAAGYVTKPFAAQLLLKRVAQLLGINATAPTATNVSW